MNEHDIEAEILKVSNQVLYCGFSPEEYWNDSTRFYCNNPHFFEVWLFWLQWRQMSLYDRRNSFSFGLLDEKSVSDWLRALYKTFVSSAARYSVTYLHMKRLLCHKKTEDSTIIWFLEKLKIRKQHATEPWRTTPNSRSSKLETRR